MATMGSMWTTAGAGTLDHDDGPFLRRYFVIYAELRGAGVRVFWSDDGTSTGTSLFSTSLMPWVSATITGAGDERNISATYYGGPMYVEARLADINEYSWWTFYDSTASLWTTQIFRRGDPGADSSTERTATAVVFLHAVGNQAAGG